MPNIVKSEIPFSFEYIMYTTNYLGQSISVCRATSRKVQSLPKDRAKKRVGTFKNRLSKVYNKFL